jgi:hypothetical protein
MLQMWEACNCGYVDICDPCDFKDIETVFGLRTKKVVL